MFRHIVLFQIRENTSDEKIEEAINLLKRLGEMDFKMIEWTVTKSLDIRKGNIIIENGLFENKQAFQEFHDSKYHLSVADFMKEISDWLVGDYEDEKI